MHWWETLIISVIGALVGGGITGYFTLRAVDKSHKNTIALQKQNQQNLVRAFLQAIHDEIETLWKQYYVGVGHKLESLQPGQALLTYYPVTQEYFTVYTSNASLIGHIEEPSLRKLIVQVYSLGRGLIDSYRMNNEMVAKYDNWMYLYQITNILTYQQNALVILQNLQNYSTQLQQSHYVLKNLAGQLLQQLS